jgi:hypothetical protein
VVIAVLQVHLALGLKQTCASILQTTQMKFLVSLQYKAESTKEIKFVEREKLCVTHQQGKDYLLETMN